MEEDSNVSNSNSVAALSKSYNGPVRFTIGCPSPACSDRSQVECDTRSPKSPRSIATVDSSCQTVDFASPPLLIYTKPKDDGKPIHSSGKLDIKKPLEHVPSLDEAFEDEIDSGNGSVPDLQSVDIRVKVRILAVEDNLNEDEDSM